MRFYKDHYDVVIIGGALAGMAAALQLQAKGVRDILILEKHNMPGGVATDYIDARASESVAVALERSAIPVDTHCRNGECGFCRSQLLGGDIFVSPIGDGRRAMDKELGWFHACSAYPLSDLKIKIPIM